MFTLVVLVIDKFYGFHYGKSVFSYIMMDKTLENLVIVPVILHENRVPNEVESSFLQNQI